MSTGTGIHISATNGGSIVPNGRVRRELMEQWHVANQNVDHDASSILRNSEHRPFAMAHGPWMMFQGWDHLLLAHWRLAPEELRPLVPTELELDAYDGNAWVGLVPFWMRNVRLRGTPILGRLSNFPEINLRTYVRVNDEPGVYFFSLDTTSRALIGAARTWLRLPYFGADMAARCGERATRMRSVRWSSRGNPAALTVEYRPTREARTPERGSLEWFLTERYRVYSVLGPGSVLALDVHHAPWSIAPAEARFREQSMLTAAGLGVTGPPDLLHYSARQDVLLWPARRIQHPTTSSSIVYSTATTAPGANG